MKIQINDQSWEVPESWNELSLKQQIGCYGILMTDSRNYVEPQELLPFKRISLVKYLLGLDESFMKEWEQDCIHHYGDEDGPAIYLGELNEILNATDFLFDKIEIDGNEKHMIKLGLTQNPWPDLEFTKKKSQKKKKYYGPADGLSNMSIYELGISFTLFERYLQNQKVEAVDELIATIYRPPKQATKENKQAGYQGDRRQPLLNHEAMIKKRKKEIAQMPSPAKQLIVFWFASCRQQIVENNPNIFEEPKGEKVGNDYGWGGVLIAIANGIVDLDKVAKQPYQNAFTYLGWLEDQRKIAEMRAAKANR